MTDLILRRLFFDQTGGKLQTGLLSIEMRDSATSWSLAACYSSSTADRHF